jgi:hypothetical protein
LGELGWTDEHEFVVQPRLTEHGVYVVPCSTWSEV